MKLLNLNEGFFPIKLDFEQDSVEVPNIGDLSTKLRVKIEISKISKGILKCKGEIQGEFLDNCQKCLEKTTIKLDDTIDVVIKDIKEIYSDNSEEGEVHYQELEIFNLDTFLNEEIALLYPDFVKCSIECQENNEVLKEEKNLPFKKIRDLID